MTKVTKELIITLFLVGVLAITIYHQVGKVRKGNTENKSREIVSSSPEPEIKEEEEKETSIPGTTATKQYGKKIQLQKEKFSQSWGRDPFYLREEDDGGDTESEKPLPFEWPKFELNGILWDPEKPLAVINNSVVKEGDIVEGVKIKKIKPGYVVLEKEGIEQTLTLTEYLP